MRERDTIRNLLREVQATLAPTTMSEEELLEINRGINKFAEVLWPSLSTQFKKGQEYASLRIVGDHHTKRIEAICVMMPYRFLEDIHERVVTVAHEIGHLEDFLIRYGGDPQLFYLDFGEDGDVKRRGKGEYIAWKNAANMLRRFRYRDWDYFYSLARSCLQSYFDENMREEYEDYTHQLLTQISTYIVEPETPERKRGQGFR